jgi:ATP-dependent RNA helicase RhlE
MSGFSRFNFSPTITENIARAGFLEPTPIQREAIPQALEGHDLLALAQTGTGKTAAFSLPMLQRLLGGPRKRVRALIVAPTRELAEQIHEVILTLGKSCNLRSMTIYGGASMNRQLGELRRGVEIVVACPGRLLDHMQQRSIDLSGVEILVLDEADQMFDMGFLPGIRKIVAALPQKRQTMLFSATMPDAIRKLSMEILDNPRRVELERGPVATISHALYPVSHEQKTALLLHLLKDAGSDPILVFTRTKHKATRLADQLGKAGYTAVALQGNLSQNQRQRSLDGFRSGKYQILVATDIAARGIDVNNISHIINYDIPATSETYIHRIGRTARATKSGDAYTFVTGEDKATVRDIEKALGKPIEKRMLEDFDYKGTAPVVTSQPITQQQAASRPKPARAGASQQRQADKRPTQKAAGPGRPAEDRGRTKAAGKPRRRRFKGFGKKN